MRKKDDSLRETLLTYVRTLADTQGIEAINMRSIAQIAGVSTGTVYNYFQNKDEILLALTEQYWSELLQDMRTAITAPTFVGQLAEIFTFLKAHIHHWAGALMASLSNVQTTGRERMTVVLAGLEQALIARMEQDSTIGKDIWNEHFTQRALARFIVSNFMALLKDPTGDATFLLEMLRRILYS